MKNGFSEINNTSFYYEISGTGFPLVLVHAGIADNRMWNDQFHVFAEKYQTIRYDRRGFGKTKMVAGDFSLHNDLYAFLKSIGIEQAILIGCSQGGKTVTNFAVEHPEMTAMPPTQLHSANLGRARRSRAPQCAPLAPR